MNDLKFTTAGDYMEADYESDDGPLTDDQLNQIRKLNMNDKIKELARQAQVEHCISHVRLEEFANLIIQECNNLNKQVITQSNLGHYMVIERIMKKYQDHFGVDYER
jgi:hypothetical protein